MCNDYELKQAVGKALEGYISDVKPFTSWEVTQEVRLDIGRTVSHASVRDLVYEAWPGLQQRGYTRTLASLPEVRGQQPWVYHPPGADLSRYRPVRRVSPFRKLLAYVGIGR